jgi:hypothetical protein
LTIIRVEARVRESSGSIASDGLANARAVEDRLKCFTGAVKSGTMSGTDSNYAGFATKDEEKSTRRGSFLDRFHQGNWILFYLAAAGP